MMVVFPRSGNIHEGDLIALNKDDHFIGYGTVITVLEESVLVDLDRKSSAVFNILHDADIPFDVDMM